MKILSCAYDDYANFMFDNTRALQSVGLDAKGIKLRSHAFGYINQAPVVSDDEMKRQIAEADIIQVFHSNLKCLGFARDYKRPDAKIIGWHTGTPYRNDPQMMNDNFNPHCEFVLTDQCEFMFLGGKNIQYVATAVDTDLIQWDRKGMSNPKVFAHYPSNPVVKGSDKICEAMRKLVTYNEGKVVFDFSSERVSHSEQLARMKKCDIYIELHKPHLNDKEYGCYGVTAFEAAAMGKVVVTNNIYPNTYPNAYGCDPEFVIANNDQQLFEKLDMLIHEDNSDILLRQENHREWIVMKHSYKATGNKLKNILFA